MQREIATFFFIALSVAILMLALEALHALFHKPNSTDKRIPLPKEPMEHFSNRELERWLAFGVLWLFLPILYLVYEPYLSSYLAFDSVASWSFALFFVAFWWSFRRGIWK